MTVDPGTQGASQERSLGVAAIDDDPQRFSGLFDDRGNPLDQTGGQHELRGKRPATPFRNLGHRLTADVEHRPQRQGQSAKTRMPDGQREGHPDMSVKILLVGRSRRGVVVNVGAFDLRAVPLGRCVVEDRQEPIAQRQCPQNQRQQRRGDRFGLASKGCQEVIIVLVIGTDPCRPQPGRHSPPPVGKENAHEQDRQSPAIAGMQARRQPLAPLGPIFRGLPMTFRIAHPWLSCHLRRGKRLVTEEPFSLQDQF